MLLLRAAPLLLLIYIATKSQASGDSEELRQLRSTVEALKRDFDTYKGAVAQHADYIEQGRRHTLWAERDDLKKWVKKTNFNEEPFKTLFTGDFLQSIDQRLKRLEKSQPDVDHIINQTEGINKSLQNVQKEITTLKETVPDIENRLTQTEGVTEQLQCGASERLEPVCKPLPEWITVVVGGWTDSGRTNGVQVLGDDPAITLPDYPLSVGDNRVTAIGTKLFSCGGAVSGKGASDECFMIDMKDTYKTWQKSHTLPRASYQHHISGANGDIMAIYRDGAISVNSGNNATIYEGFDKGSTDWESCLASNSTHSFFVHGGIIYMNTNASDPANWENITAIDISGEGVACLLFDAVLYITQHDKLFLINTSTFVVVPGAAPNTPRRYHGMAVLDDRVAVVGGWDGGSSSGSKLDSIETYDRQYNKWQTLARKMLEPVSSFGIVSLLV